MLVLPLTLVFCRQVEKQDLKTFKKGYSLGQDGDSMTTENIFTRRFDLRIPLIVAPMGGGPTTPELVAGSSKAGALGTLAGAYLSPDDIVSAVQRVRNLTQRPFAINLFTAMPEVRMSDMQFKAAIEKTRPYRQELGLRDPELKPPLHPDFDRQFEAVLKSQPAAFSFIFGRLDRHYLVSCRAQGIYSIGTATTLEEGLILEEMGVDAVVGQGVEAGAHRGMFDATAMDSGVPAQTLTLALAKKLKIPVIAAGGFMNGRDISRALDNGAQAVQMGTAFLLCPEAGTSKPYREALLRHRSIPTQLTRAFSGRWARGLPNRFMKEIDSAPESILPFPLQNAFTRDIRAKSAQIGSADCLSLWAGAGVASIRADRPVEELIHTLLTEMNS
jgi:nitronate monooxygenase